MTIIQFRRYLYIPLFLSLALLVGCSDKGVRLDGMVLNPSGTGASLTTGDQATDGTCTNGPCNPGTTWNDSFITPNGSKTFTIAIKSAGLMLQTDTTTPSYTIFDTGDISNPKIVTFTPGSNIQIGTNPNAPADGTYDRIQYVLSYIEMLIPINYQNTSSQQRRVRFYLASYNDQTLGQAVSQNDILFDNTSGALNWIDPGHGLGTFISTKGTFNVWQVPNGSNNSNFPGLQNQFMNFNTNGGTVDSATADPYTFTINLANPVTVSGDNKYDFQLIFDTTKIFFFDETHDPAITDPIGSWSNINFNPPLTSCHKNTNSLTDAPCDGRLDASPPAFFWPGLPAVTASGSGSAGGSTTTTTTTVSTTTTT